MQIFYQTLKSHQLVTMVLIIMSRQSTKQSHRKENQNLKGNRSTINRLKGKDHDEEF